MYTIIFVIDLYLSSASLAHKEHNGYLRLQRSMEVANKRSLYQWVEKDRDEQGDFHGFPGYTIAGSDATALPKDFRFL